MEYFHAFLIDPQIVGGMAADGHRLPLVEIPSLHIAGQVDDFQESHNCAIFRCVVRGDVSFCLTVIPGEPTPQPARATINRSLILARGLPNVGHAS